jgi:hypothetical protein
MLHRILQSVPLYCAGVHVYMLVPMSMAFLLSVEGEVEMLSWSSKLLKPRNPHLLSIALSSSHPEQGVVSIVSPVKMAFAPAMKACKGQQ